MKTNNGKSGGVLEGKSHNAGGIQAVIVDTNEPVELEQGEVIINKKSAAKHREILSEINQDGGGVPIPKVGNNDSNFFESGGVIGEIQEDYTKAVSDLFLAEKFQSEAKLINKAVRDSKLSDLSTLIPHLIDKGFDPKLISELALLYNGQIKIKQYVLTNNNARIKRLKDRVNLLQKKLEGSKKQTETGESNNFVFDGGIILINYEIDRVQIIFDSTRVEKPLYQKLRQNGWIFSYTNSAFQRKITSQAISNAVKLFDAKKANSEIESENPLSPLDMSIPQALEKIDTRDFAYVTVYASKAFQASEIYANLIKVKSGKFFALRLVYFSVLDYEIKDGVRNYFKQYFPDLDVNLLDIVSYKSKYISESRDLVKSGLYLPNALDPNLFFGNNYMAIFSETNSPIPETKMYYFNRLTNVSLKSNDGIDTDAFKRGEAIEGHFAKTPDILDETVVIIAPNGDEYTVPLNAISIKQPEVIQTIFKIDGKQYDLSDLVLPEDHPIMILDRDSPQWKSSVKEYFDTQSTTYSRGQTIFINLGVESTASKAFWVPAVVVSIHPLKVQTEQGEIIEVTAKNEHDQRIRTTLPDLPQEDVDIIVPDPVENKIKQSEGLDAVVDRFKFLHQDNDQIILDQITPRQDWQESLPRQQEIKRQIFEALQGVGEEDKFSEVERLFKKFVDQNKTPKQPIVDELEIIPENTPKTIVNSIFQGITFEYKNQYVLNKAIEEFLQMRGDSSFDYDPEEKAFLRKYSGYGGLDKYGKTAKGGLFEFYTPVEIIERMWGLAYKYGYNNGSVLEPAVGTGEFLQFLPENASAVGYDISEWSAKICKILYPTVNVMTQPFEKLFIKNNFSVKDNVGHLEKFDLVIGNPPYGNFDYVESRYMSGMGERKHTGAKNYVEYFLRRSIDLLKPDGVLVFIVGAQLINGGTMFLDSQISAVKEYLADNCSLMEAYRLPDSVFERTGVTTDIIVLKKN